MKNVCTRCNQQQVECDHTQFHEETMDLSQYGVCTEKITYQTCVCRQVRKLDESVEFDCWFDDPKFTHVSEKENKDLLLKMEGSCPLCGLTVYQEGLLKADPVTGKRDGTGVAQITLKKGDEVIFEATMEGTMMGNSVSVSMREYRMIDLAQYGACEGVLFVEKSYSGVENVRDLISECDIDLNKVPEPVVTTDANGVEHETYTVSCSKCGLKAVADQWTEKVDDCTSLEHSSVSITCGDKTIFTSDDQTHEGSHQWEITDKQLLGETCEDGVKLTCSCSACNKSEIDYSFRHSTEEGQLKDYVSSTCSCVDMTVDVCKYCTKVTNIEIFYNIYGVGFERENIADSDGEVIGEKYSFTCPTCQMKYVRETKTVAVDDCHSIQSTHQYVYDAQGQCLLDVLCDEEETTTHKCDYQYYILGEDCYDGYFAVGTCENCKQPDIFVYGGHVWEDKPIDLSQYGCCQNEISCRKCKVCGEMQPNFEDLNCQFETTNNGYTDDNGIEHVTETMVCSECGLTLKGERTITKDGCTSIESLTITISKGETVVWTMEIEETFASHDYKDEKKYFVGDDCSDGVYIVKSCQCGEQYIERHSIHSYTSSDTYLDELGFCGGMLRHLICDICGTENCFVQDSNCMWGEPTEDSHGYEVYQCSVCRGTRKEKETRTAIDACHIKEETTYVYQGTTGDPITFTTTETIVTHDYNLEYRLNGETCEDGWTATATCTVCGALGRGTAGRNHNYERQDVYLSQYGLCDEHLWINECSICHNKSVSVEDSGCDWVYQESDANGYDVFECSQCHITKLEKDTISDKDENCYITQECTIIYRNGAEELYRITATGKFSDHDYSYTYDPETPDCSSDELYDCTATCKDCHHTEQFSTEGHHCTDFNRVPIGDYGCWVCEDICDICKETVRYWLVDSACSWGSFTINEEGYSVRVCAECGLIQWQKWDQNTQTLEYVFFDNNNKELYRYTV